MFLTNIKNYIEEEIKVSLKKEVKIECSELTDKMFFEELDNNSPSFLKTDFGYILLPIDFINFMVIIIEKDVEILLKNLIKKLNNKYKYINLSENLVDVRNKEIEKDKYKYFVCYITMDNELIKIGLIIKLNYLFLEENNLKENNNIIINKIKKIKEYIENAELKGNINTPKICINLDNAKELLKDIDFIETELNKFFS